ncbi:PilZ domain-containing protein [Oricola cellulosilytica]|uniref:PilZ domain-containing protein n=1 Tax=Oricola cellulosilytica TaxID=1429082 RepID=A0A4R0PBE5_9HYPH|nr:PilZ domain-containing protein [Oricola cellulosilytica]TCD14582.1 PilZ domain-containing protein [Oricola cellulosilytica]
MLGAQDPHLDHDRRQFQRVKVILHGRLMLADRSEHRCQVNNMSPGSAWVATEGAAEVGERVIAYIDHIGRIEGTVSRLMPEGFALELNTTPRKKAKLAAQLTWFANKRELDLPEDRRHERIAPRNSAGVVTLDDGRQYRCRIIDLSLSGAAVEINVRPAIGAQITLGNMRGQVVRHFEEGIAIEFAVVQRRESLKEYLG